MTAHDSRLLRRLASGLALFLALVLAAPAARAQTNSGTAAAADTTGGSADQAPPPDDTTAPPPDDTTAPPPGTGTAPATDGGTAAPSDNGTAPPPDTTAPPPDTGTAPPPDTTAPPPDTGTTPPPDTGTTPPPDTGTTPPPDQGSSATPPPATPPPAANPPAATPPPAATTAPATPAAPKNYGIDPLTGVPLGSSGPREEAHVLIQRKDRDEGKNELSLTVPILVNGKFVNEVGTGLDYLYHFRETFALGLGGTFFELAQNSAFTDNELLEKARQAPIVADALIMRWEAHAGMEVSPIYGKFAVFNLGVAQFGFFLGAGGGVTQTRTELQYDPKSGNRTFGDTGVLPMGYLSGGFRLFFSQHIALRLEVRDYIYAAQVNKINGCTGADLLPVKNGSAGGSPSAGCNISAFGSDSTAVQTNANIAYQLLNGTPDEVLNNVMFTTALSVLF